MLELLTAACSELARCGRKSRREDAEDVTQDACVHMLRLASPQSVREPARYLARIARNLFVDHGRRRKRETTLFDSSADVELAGHNGLDPERITEGEQALLRALGAIEEMPPRCREAFGLHRFEGLSYIAIAHRMGISVSMVEKHIAEAMLRLAEEVAPNHYEVGARPRRVRGRG
jgi:RNA polymerase sigma-70 factor (ECF subfamily)